MKHFVHFVANYQTIQYDIQTKKIKAYAWKLSRLVFYVFILGYSPWFMIGFMGTVFSSLGVVKTFFHEKSFFWAQLVLEFKITNFAGNWNLNYRRGVFLAIIPEKI